MYTNVKSVTQWIKRLAFWNVLFGQRLCLTSHWHMRTCSLTIFIMIISPKRRRDILHILYYCLQQKHRVDRAQAVCCTSHWNSRCVPRLMRIKTTTFIIVL